jgi:hypothetical protein
LTVIVIADIGRYEPTGSSPAHAFALKIKAKPAARPAHRALSYRSVMPQVTSFHASYMPHDTSFHTSFTPKVTPRMTPFHANGLGLSI